MMGAKQEYWTGVSYDWSTACRGRLGLKDAGPPVSNEMIS